MKTRSVKKYLFLTLIAVLCAACVAVGCLFMGGGTPSVGATAKEHDEAFGNTHDEKGKALTEAGGELSEGAYYLNSDIALTADITIADNATVDLCLNGYKLTGTGNGPVITVENNATFNLHDCDGSDGSHSYSINEHGKYEFADGGSNTNTLSGGVITGGTGEVDGNNTYGGGIFLKKESGATFTMYGGTIAGNMAKRDITTDGYSKGDATYGGGVAVNGGTFKMYGGTIEGNTAGSSSGTNDETGGYNNDHDRGGGVAVSGGIFNMYGGTIKNNCADDGGGIYVDGDGFKMYNAEVSNNFARHNGGGIYINDGTAIIGETDANGNTTVIIENNRANSFAGGIYVNRESSELQLKNGTVTGNTAMAGGGIYVHSNAQNSGSLVLGGEDCSVTIKGNSAIYYPDRPTEATNGYGGGVFMRNAGVPSNIDMSGTITITGNNSKPNGKDNADSDNLYLEDGIAINAHTTAEDNIDGSPDDNLKINANSQIGITLAARGDNYFNENTFIVNGFGSGVTVDTLKNIFSSDVGGDLNVVISDNGKITIGSFNYSIPVDSTYAEARNDYTVAIQGTKPNGAQSGTTYDNDTFKIESRTEIITFTVTAPKGDDYLSVIINGGWGRNLNDEGEPPTAYIYNFATFSDDYDREIFAYTTGEATVSVTIPYTLYASSLISAEDEADKGIHLAYIGAEASVTKDDTTTYYYTIEQAFGAAVSGTTITLLKDADTANTLNVMCDVTLDLSGHALSMASGVQGSVISVASGFNFTLQDSPCTDKKHTNHTHTITVGEDTVSISGGLITGGSAERGGGIYTDGGNVTMSGGTIAGNTASQNGGGVCVDGGTFTMTGGEISNNTATGREGGGVYVYSSGTFNMQAAADGTTPTISGNTSFWGGGVFVTGSDTTFTMSGGEISSNTATTYGGGVYVENYGTFTMSGGTIGGDEAAEANSAAEGGGVYVKDGTFTMQAAADGNAAPTISDNTAISGGGGVYANYGTFNMSGGTISNNTATGDGGGVCANYGTFNMSGGTISNNTATTGNGGGVYFNDGTFHITGGEISNNTASQNGGGVYVEDGTFTMQAAADGTAPTISGNTSFWGGGVFVTGSDTTFTMSAGEISGNEATDSGGGVCVVGGTFNMSDTAKISANSAAEGGGVYVDGGTFTMQAAADGNAAPAISDNTAISGGGVYLASGSFTMQAAADGSTAPTISGNESNRGGGGVFVYGSSTTFTMSGGEISDNETAFYGGGGVYLAIGTFTMSGTATISNNTAKRGGGVYVSGNNATFTMTGGTIGGSADVEANKATDYGGGVYVGINAKFEMSGTAKISGNEATDSGGVCVDGGTFNMSDTAKISANSAASGGGVYVSSGTFTMSGGTISGNTASNNGGGVYVYSGIINLSGSPTIFGNTVNGAANDLYLSSGIVINSDNKSNTLKGGKIGVTLADSYADTIFAYTASGNDATSYFSSDAGGVVELTSTADANGYKLYYKVKVTVSGLATGVTPTFGDVEMDLDGSYYFKLYHGKDDGSFTVTAPTGYEVSSVTIFGTESSGTYTVSHTKYLAATSDKSIEVVFKNKQITSITWYWSQGEGNDVGITDPAVLPYNGKVYTITAVGYTSDGAAVPLDVAVSQDEIRNAGTYALTASATGYTFATGVNTLSLTISKADYDMTGISFEDIAVTYDGKEHKPVISGTLPTGADGIQVTVNYSVGATNVCHGVRQLQRARVNDGNCHDNRKAAYDNGSFGNKPRI